MCIGNTTDSADALGMDQPGPIYNKTCQQCDLPALTFDENGDALCVRHANVFIAAEAPPDETEDEDDRDE